MLLHTSNANSDDWRLWLTAAGLPTNLSTHPGVTFDLIFMTVQAAIDGVGVAMGRTAYVQDDIAKGRLVVPFKITLPTDAGFYLVSPTGRTDSPKLSAFRQWLTASAQKQGLKRFQISPRVRRSAPFSDPHPRFAVGRAARAWQIAATGQVTASADGAFCSGRTAIGRKLRWRNRALRKFRKSNRA